MYKVVLASGQYSIVSQTNEVISVNLGASVHNKKHLMQMERTLPILFLSGEEDPVGGYGAGVRAAAEAFQKAGVHKVSLRLYSQGRHEMLNELNRDEVYGDILHWIEKL